MYIRYFGGKSPNIRSYTVLANPRHLSCTPLVFYVHMQQQGSLHTRVAFILRASCLCPHAATSCTTDVWHLSCVPLLCPHAAARLTTHACGIYPTCLLFFMSTRSNEAHSFACTCATPILSRQQRGSLHTRVAFILHASCLCPLAATSCTIGVWSGPPKGEGVVFSRQKLMTLTTSWVRLRCQTDCAFVSACVLG